MKGGYQILDLRNIGLELKATQQTITNVEILNQLRELRNHIEKGHDYAKGLNNALKCVMIRYRDAKNGEKEEVCQFCDIISSNSSLNFDIIGKDLKIQVVFEEKTDDDGNKYFDIKSAKYYFTKNQNIEGNLNIEGDLDVTGKSNFSDDANFEGDVSIENDLDLTGDMSVGANSNIKVFENIVDKNGNKRFIEGEVTLFENQTDLAKVYGKWSLSGTHLLIVFCVSGLENGEVKQDYLTDVINIPDWVLAKITPLVSGISYVATQDLVMRGAGWASQTVTCALRFDAQNKLRLAIPSTTTALTRDSAGRVQFDLLIDDEEIVNP